MNVPRDRQEELLLRVSAVRRRLAHYATQGCVLVNIQQVLDALDCDKPFVAPVNTSVTHTVADEIRNVRREAARVPAIGESGTAHRGVTEMAALLNRQIRD